jgi:hypothetical protein
VILFDPQNGLAQSPMQAGVAREVLAYRITDAHELSLDDPLLGLSPLSKQHIAVARGEPQLALRDGVRGEA